MAHQPSFTGQPGVVYMPASSSNQYPMQPQPQFVQQGYPMQPQQQFVQQGYSMQPQQQFVQQGSGPYPMMQQQAPQYGENNTYAQMPPSQTTGSTQ